MSEQIILVRFNLIVIAQGLSSRSLQQVHFDFSHLSVNSIFPRHRTHKNTRISIGLSQLPQQQQKKNEKKKNKQKIHGPIPIYTMCVHNSIIYVSIHISKYPTHFNTNTFEWGNMIWSYTRTNFKCILIEISPTKMHAHIAHIASEEGHSHSTDTGPKG